MNYLLEALCKKLEGDIAMAYANIKAYERNVVGIGEHPDVLAAIQDQIDIIAHEEERIEVLDKHFNEHLHI